MKYYLGLDVGGTNLAAGILDENYHILEKMSIPAGAGRDIAEITADMAKVSKMVMEKAGVTTADVSSWGIGMPSYVNPSTGLLVHANCFGWRNVPIYSYLEHHFDLPIYIENDANCAVLGETLAGVGAGCKNVLMLTLGTGVGSGIILDNKIYAGADFLGAEFGHTKLIYHGKQCTCGQFGCVDTYCSARGLVEQAKDALSENRNSLLLKFCKGDLSRMSSKTVFDAAEAGDDTALKVLDQYIDYLSCAISNFVVVFRPEVVILGGGVANAGDVLVIPLQKKIYENTFASKEIGVPPVKVAKCGNDAGIIGAAFLEKYGMDRRKK